MKLALAQIDMRLGDIEGICGRIEDQARLAHERGARMLCVPAPLFMGAMPGGLVGAADFEHDMLTGLTGVAERIQELDMICIVPAAVSFEGQPLLDYMMLKDGRVVPARTSIALQRGESNDARWAPPVFDVDGVRIAVVFDLDRELEMLPTGVDLIAYFQFNAFDMTDRETAAVAAVRSGAYRKIASKRSVWFACMAPIGAYDESVYTGGSFVLDDCGRVVAQAPCFEESLLVQEIQRGVMLDALEDHELPQFRSEEWLWQALVLAVRDNARARGASRAVVALEGDLPSSLLAALAVDALGPRNVIGLVLGRNRIFTPAQEEAEAARCSAVRSIAERLHIRTVERDAPDAARVLDRDVSAGDAERLRSRALGLMLEDTALELGAMALSPLSKTEYALAAPALCGGYQGDYAPFGDVYLSTLEFVARVRNRASAVVPQELVTLNAVEDCMDRVLVQALSTLAGPVDMLDRAAQLLHELRIGEMPGTRCPDTALDAHAEQCEVAQQIEQLVTRQLVGKTQFEIIEIAARDADVLLVEDLFEVGQLFVRNGIFHHDDRIVQIAALDEVHLEERFQFVQEDERPARGDLRGVVVVGKEGGVLVADDLRVVVDVHRGGELLVGIEDDRNALVGNRVDHLFGHLVVFAVGVLFDEARGDDLFGVFARRTVHDRGFGGVDVDQRVVDAERPERRHDVFYRGYLHAVGLDGRPARSVGHIIAQRRDERGSLHVDATENDAVVHTGGIDRHGHLDTRVQSLTRKGDRAFQGLLFC